MPPGSSSSRAEKDDNKGQHDASQPAQNQEMHHDAVEPPNDAMASRSNLHRQPTIELSNDDSEDKDSEILPIKEQEE